MGFTWATESQEETLRPSERQTLSLCLYYDGHALDGGSSISLYSGVRTSHAEAPADLRRTRSWRAGAVTPLLSHFSRQIMMLK